MTKRRHTIRAEEEGAADRSESHQVPRKRVVGLRCTCPTLHESRAGQTDFYAVLAGKIAGDSLHGFSIQKHLPELRAAAQQRDT